MIDFVRLKALHSMKEILKLSGGGYSDLSVSTDGLTLLYSKDFDCIRLKYDLEDHLKALRVTADFGAPEARCTNSIADYIIYANKALNGAKFVYSEEKKVLLEFTADNTADNLFAAAPLLLEIAETFGDDLCMLSLGLVPVEMIAGRIEELTKPQPDEDDDDDFELEETAEPDGDLDCGDDDDDDDDYDGDDGDLFGFMQAILRGERYDKNGEPNFMIEINENYRGQDDDDENLFPNDGDNLD